MPTQRIRSYTGLLIVIALCAFPVVLWLAMKPLELRFGSWVMWATSIGQLSALVGLAMFSVSLMLIARVPFLEPFFGGMDRIFEAHRHLGMVGFLLMLVHPLALAVRIVPVSVSDAALFFVPSFGDIARSLGILALLLMMAVIAATLYAHWRYQILLKTHKTLGIAFMFGVLHAFLIPSDISNNMLLGVYCGLLAFGGFAAFLYRTVFASAIPKHHYKVTAVRKLDPTLTEVSMEPVGAPLSFKPGQFVFVSYLDPSVSKEIHPFSISSSPYERTLRLTIKALGDWTSEVAALSVGSEAWIEGPFGGFTADRAVTNKEVWVAGGVGITPFLSRARAFAKETLKDREVDLYYCVNTREELVFEHELAAIMARASGFRLIPYVSKERGLLTAATLAEHSGSLRDRDIFVCGPPLMMKSIIRQCKDLRVRASQIHAEEFAML